MDFSLLIFIFIAWTIFSKVKGAGKGLASAANSESAKETLAKVHARIRAASAEADEFETSAEAPKQWNEMSPTQRGRERARQKGSYPGSSQSSNQSSTQSSSQSSNQSSSQSYRQSSQPSLQQRLDAASKNMSAVRKVKEFKQGSERKVKRQELGRGKDYGLSSRHAPQKDQNRHRRDDWGQKGGGEIITTKSLLVLLALGFIVVYVLSKVSPSDLGF